jgi:very-short-patch-repair endonuclease
MTTESAKRRNIRSQARTRERGGVDGEHPDRRVSRLAGGQYGVVSRRQLVRLGLSTDAIDYRQQVGRLYRMHAGVYAVGHEIVPREGWWLAAVLSCGHGAVLSHCSAAALWLIRPNSRRRIDVTVAHPSRSARQIYRHISAVPPDERTEEKGIPVTTMPRTILDLAATESSNVVESLLREAEYRRLHNRLSLRDLVERYPGRRGVRRVRAALERLEEESGQRRSPLEERFASFLRRHRLPMPSFNDWIVIGSRRFQVDCHWPGTEQIVELDGWRAHGTRSAFRDDRARDRILRVAGYSATRLTWSQLDDEPEAVAADLRELLRGAGPARRG